MIEFPTIVTSDYNTAHRPLAADQKSKTTISAQNLNAWGKMFISEYPVPEAGEIALPKFVGPVQEITQSCKHSETRAVSGQYGVEFFTTDRG